MYKKGLIVKIDVTVGFYQTKQKNITACIYLHTLSMSEKNLNQGRNEGELFCSVTISAKFHGLLPIMLSLKGLNKYFVVDKDLEVLS